MWQMKLQYVRDEEIISYERKEAVKETMEEAIKNITSICQNSNAAKEVTAKPLHKDFVSKSHPL